MTAREHPTITSTIRLDKLPPGRGNPLACCEAAPHHCPHCGLIMSHREAAEQGACNECAGGAR